ncbi:alpha/beta fold hydrolase [Corynebacterium aquilae]|uniref:alpha/beta fold hydrolase n=1 Tax=Corynebacterium aquilae TaxID=203263 RepID=UPI00095312A6|nr:alpha/beta hydrolase [Corynebacterium aquilae]
MNRPLVMIHGTSGTFAGHYGTIAPMLGRYRDVSGIDWSPTGDTFELDDIIEQVMKAAPDGEFDLVGFSLGAVAAAAIAARDPERVGALALIAGWITTDAQQKLRNGIWSKLYDENSGAIREYMAFCAFSPGFILHTPPAAIAPAIEALPINEFIRAQMDLNARIDISGEVGRITAPTLIVSCTKDTMVPPHHQQQLFGAIENSRLRHIESGHMVVMERAQEITAVLTDFFNDPERHAPGTTIANEYN